MTETASPAAATASRRAFLHSIGAGIASVGVVGVAPASAAPATSAAGPPETAWSRRYTESHLSRFYTIVPVDGGYVLGGVVGGHDDLRGLLVRTDAAGRPRWQRTYGTVKSGIAGGAPHPDGGVVLAGGTNLDDSSPVAETPLSSDPWLLRVDDAGDVVWTRTLQPTAAAGRIDALARGDGGYLVAGHRRERRRTHPRPWAARLSVTGHRRWATTLGGERERGALQAAASRDGAWYVGGSTSPAADDPDEGGHAGDAETALVARLTADGNVRWRRTADTRAGSRLEGLHAEADGVVAVGNRGFDTDDDGQGWHLRLDSEGDLVWEETHSTGPWNWLDGLTPVEGGDGYLLVGTRERPPAGDDPNGPRGAWVLRTDAAGAVRWETTYFDGDWGYGETVHALDEGFLVAGSTGTADQRAWLLGVGDVPSPAAGSGVADHVERFAEAVPPTADDVGLGVLLGAGAVTLGRRLLGGD